MGFPDRARAAPTIQRRAMESRRSGRTSVGTWYVAPPTRRERTSRAGVTLRTACSKTSSPGRFDSRSRRSSAPYTAVCATDFPPPIITLLMKRASRTLLKRGSGAIILRSALRRRAIRSLVRIEPGAATPRRVGANEHRHWGPQALACYLGLWPGGAVLAAPLLPALYAGSVESATHHVI